MTSNNLPDIYFLPEWGNLFQELDKGESLIFEFNQKVGRIYYQFIKREIPIKIGKDTYYDIITPYGFSGPVILQCEKGNETLLVQQFHAAFTNYCNSEKIVTEYCRFNPWLKNHLYFQPYYSLKNNRYTLYTDLTVKDFFMEEYCKKVRTKIRKAANSGIELEFDYTGKTINEFYRLYQNTVAKNDISDYYQFSLEFLVRSFHILEKKQFIINARYQGECITSSIFLVYNDYLHCHLVANDYREYPQNANSLILYEACKWGVNQGKSQMHFGGGYTDELFNFKRQFTQKGFCDFYVGSIIRNEEIYNELVKLKSKCGEISNSNYFPLYRG